MLTLPTLTQSALTTLSAAKPKKGPNLAKFDSQPHWHLSLRYDRTESLKKRAIMNAMRAASTITVTEVWEHRNLLPEYANAKGWRVRQRLDTAVMWDSEVWGLVADLSESIHGKWTKGASYVTDNIGVPMVVLRHRVSGVVIVLVGTHLQASAEGDWSGARAIAHRWCSTHIRVKANRAASRYGAQAIIWGADWNLNWHREWVKRHVATLLANWWSCWEGAGNSTSGGTHAGRRLIDLVMMRGARSVARSTRIVSSDGASDHDFVATRWRLTPKRRSRPKIRRLAAAGIQSIADLRASVEIEVFIGDDDAHLAPIRVEETTLAGE